MVSYRGTAGLIVLDNPLLQALGFVSLLRVFVYNSMLAHRVDFPLRPVTLIVEFLICIVDNQGIMVALIFLFCVVTVGVDIVSGIGEDLIHG